MTSLVENCIRLSFTFVLYHLLNFELLYAQQEDVQFLESDMQNFFNNTDINLVNKPACRNSNGNGGNTEMTCSDPEKINPADYNIMQFDYEDSNSIPAKLKEYLPGELFQYNKSGVSIIIALPNDNKLLGLWGAIFRDDGDDYGDSHGLKVEVKKTFKNDITYTFQGQTNVYTKRIGWADNDKIDQFFTNENILKLTADNIAKGKAQYYKVGAGWVALDSKNSNSIFLASGQQTRWHDFLEIYNFNYIPDGTGVKNGIELDLFYGLQSNITNAKSTCRLRSYVEGGTSLNTVGGSYLKGEAGTMLFVENKRRTLAARVGGSANTQLHKDGLQTTASAEVGFRVQRVALDFEYNQKFGSLENNVKYNQKNRHTGEIDPTMSIKLTYIMGKFKRK